MEPKDISNELWREYTFTDGYVIVVKNPRTLYVADSGSHRVFDGRITTYIPAGWRKIIWQPKKAGAACNF